jgi:hypothetical protein
MDMELLLQVKQNMLAMIYKYNQLLVQVILLVLLQHILLLVMLMVTLGLVVMVLLLVLQHILGLKHLGIQQAMEADRALL